MSALETKRCLACEGGIARLEHAALRPLLTQVPLWELSADTTQISRRFTFKNFHATMAFINAVAWIAHQENHHPDMQVGYNYCVLNYSTHAVQGLTENDFICAAKIDRLSQ